MRKAGLLCGGGPEEALYQVYVPTGRERVCQKNLAAPRVADWLWVYEPMFTTLGVRLPFSPFVMGLLNRCDVAPSQLHPNSWAAIRYFEMVCEYLELPTFVNIFLYLFLLTNPSRQGKAKKGYMSFRAQQGRRIFGLFEDSYHGFKSTFFKVRPIEGHQPFWLTAKGERWIPTYWSFRARSDYLIKISYDWLSPEDRNIVDILLAIFGERNLNPRMDMGDREAGRSYVGGFLFL